MLVLGRHKDERIVIDYGLGKVVVTVTAILGGKVKLGFEAPDNVRVYRKELYDAIFSSAVQAGRPDRAAGDANGPRADSGGDQGHG